MLYRMSYVRNGIERHVTFFQADFINAVKFVEDWEKWNKVTATFKPTRRAQRGRSSKA